MSKLLIGFLIFLSLLTTSFAQVSGEYRSVATGNWNSASTWEIFSGGVWIPSADYPTATTTGKVSIMTGHVVTLNAPTTIKFLNMSGGVVVTSSANLLTVPSTGSITGGTVTSFIDGPVKVDVTTNNLAPKTLNLPLGKGIMGRPLTFRVKHQTATIMSYTVEMFTGAPPAHIFTAGVNSVLPSFYYNIYKTGLVATNYADYKITYDTSDGVGIDNASLRIARNDNAGNWVNLGGTGSAPNAGTIQSTLLLTSFTNSTATGTIIALGSAIVLPKISGKVNIPGTIFTYNDGGIKTVTADAAGNYAISVSKNWTGIVTPSFDGYSFSPASLSYTNLTADISAQNYTGTSLYPEYITSLSGNWEDAATWYAKDPVTSEWIQSPHAPLGISGIITIDSLHEVVLNANLIIEPGVTLVNKGTLVNGTGNVLLTVKGTYEHARDGGVIGLSGNFDFSHTTWASGSTCLITGVTDVAPFPGQMASFWGTTMVWDCPNQNGDVFLGLNLGGNSKDYYYNFGDLRVLNTNSNNLFMFSGQGRGVGNVTVDGPTAKLTAFTRSSSGIEYLFFSYFNSLTVNNGGQFFINTDPGSAAHYTTINVHNNLTVSGNSVLANYYNPSYTGPAFSKVVFTGNYPHTINLSGQVPAPGVDAGTNALNLVINNVVTAASPLNVSSLSVGNGKLLTNSNLITVLAGGNITGGSSGSFIDGPVSIQVATSDPVSLAFPVGKGTAGRPVLLNITQKDPALTTYTAEMIASPSPDNILPVGLNGVSSVRHYSITKSTGADVVRAAVTLSYDQDDNVSDNTKLRIAKTDGAGSWINLGGTGTGLNTGTISSKVNFSDFTGNVFTLATSPFSVPAGLLAYWNLDESTGNLFTDMTGVNNGTGNISPAAASGQVNGAQQFNGSNSKVEIPANSTLDFSATADFSLEFWYNGAAAPGTSKAAISRYTPAAYWYMGLHTDGKAKFYMKAGTDIMGVYGTVITNGSWHHVAVTRNGSTGLTKMYVDGVLRGTATKTFTADFASPDAKLTIGGMTGFNAYTIAGILDETALFNTELTQAEILVHYNKSAKGINYFASYAPLITSTPALNGKENVAYSYDVDADGHPAPSYSLAVMPANMTINVNTGVISWMPQTSGNYNVSVVANNGVAPADTQTFVINVTPALNLPAGLSSYWKLDETSGNAYADFTTKNPASGNISPLAVNGQVGGAQQFNGINTKLEVPADNTLDFAAADNFTIEFWYNGSGAPGTSKAAISRYVPAAYWYMGLHTDGKAKFYMKAGLDILGVYGPVITNGSWHHVAVTRNGTTGLTKMYVDGILSGSATKIFTADFSSPSVKLAIGGMIGFGGYSLNGTLDEVAIHKIELTQADVADHFNRGKIQAAYFGNYAPYFTSMPVTNGVATQPYAYDADALGLPAPTFSLLNPPAGMTIDAATGVISWTPADSGHYNITILASNSVSADTQSFSAIITLPVSLPASVIAYWKLDEASGSNYPDVSNLHNGTGSTSPTAAAGHLNNAQMFNGTNNKIETAADSCFDFAANDNFSIEFWYNGNSVPGVSKAALSRYTPAAYWYIGLHTDGRAKFYMRSGADVMGVYGTIVTDGTWHHIAATRNGTTGLTKLYVDGVLRGTATKLFTADFSSLTAKLAIGSMIGFSGYSIAGMIDEVALHRVELSAAQVLQHFAGDPLSKDMADLSSEKVPQVYNLAQNYPNPFNPSTTIKYELPADSRVTIQIFNVIGEQVAELVNDVQTAGYYNLKWNADNMPTGIYLMRIDASKIASEERYIKTVKMLLMK